jgi:pentatricopeptide repeat protein
MGRTSSAEQQPLKAMDAELSPTARSTGKPQCLPDGLRGHEGTFSLCTFFYVDALARAGWLTEAELTFQKMHTRACYR